MTRFTHVDVLIAGGGIAGSTTAAAFAREGLVVLLCEAGLPSDKRLAGELMHPPAARALDELGLLKPLSEAGGVPSYGFALYRKPTEPPTLLSYSEILTDRPTGFAIAHHRLTRTLLDTVSNDPRVTVWEGARVTSVDVNGATACIDRDGEQVQVSAGLIVSAEGRASTIRAEAGIDVSRGKAFRMVGWRVPAGRLPFPGYGHIFLGGRSATLAYQISRDETRVMFELEDGRDLGVTDLLAHLPRPFRDDVERAIETEPRQTAKVFGLASNRVTAHGCLAVVGDAGGCAHPLTATGITFCTRDACALAAHVGPALVGFTSPANALKRYERERGIAMATRGVLADELSEALSSDRPEMRALRQGLFRYWTRSALGRRTSLALLSTHISTPAALAIEYARVCAHTLPALRKGDVAASEIVDALAGLARRNVSNLKTIVAAVRTT